MSELTVTEQQQVKKVLEEAAFDIAEFGWYGGAWNWEDGEEPKDNARCIWRTYIRAFEREVGTGSYGSTQFYAGEKAILEAAGDQNIDHLFAENDSFNNETEGQAWAYDILWRAAKSFAITPSEVAVTPESVKTPEVTGWRGLWRKLRGNS